jgi:hypothetical protein
MDNIKDAICASNKLRVNLSDGKILTVHPYFILKPSNSTSPGLLRGYIEEDKGHCNIDLTDIMSSTVLPQHYAVDHSCLNFDFREYDIIFPTKEDLEKC